MKKEEYIKKWIEGTLSAEERAILESSGELKNLEKLNKALQSFKAPEYDIEASLSEMKSSRKGASKVLVLSWLRPLASIAAVFLLIISSYFFFYLNVNTTIETTFADKSGVYLPDSSFVNLNALSQISYKANFWKYKREVELEGEAFFKVASGAQFDVVTSSGVVSVLGTEFNVKNRAGFFEVVCYEGKVKVKNDNQSSDLLAGQSFRLVNGNIEKLANLKEAAPGWINDRSSFNSIPIGHVIEELERQYGVSVEIKNLNTKQLFTGSFEHNDLDLALKSITLPLSLEYQVLSDNEIIISAHSDQ